MVEQRDWSNRYPRHQFRSGNNPASAAQVFTWRSVNGSQGGRAVDESIKNVFTLIIDARVKRCGGEVRLIVPADSQTETPARPVLSLIKAIARVHQWSEQIIGGRFKGRHSIAQITGIEERYAGRILQCAFLAPDIIEAILDGRQPSDLTVQKLLIDMPLDWAEQRKQLRFVNEDSFRCSGNLPK